MGLSTSPLVLLTGPDESGVGKLDALASNLAHQWLTCLQELQGKWESLEDRAGFWRIAFVWTFFGTMGLRMHFPLAKPGFLSGRLLPHFPTGSFQESYNPFSY